MSEQSIAQQVERRAAELLAAAVIKTEIDDKFVKQCLDANERGDAVLYASINKGKYLYNTTPDKGEWYMWDGHVWAVDRTRRCWDAVESCALEYEQRARDLDKVIDAEGITKERGKATPWQIAMRDKYMSRIDRLRGVTGIGKVLDLAPVVAPEMACQETDFDQKQWMLPCANGVIDLQSGALTSGRPADRLFRRIGVRYDPTADYADWHAFVVEVCGSEEVARFIQRSLGYALTGFSLEQFVWIFLGPGRNGKGVLFGIIGEILGPYYHEINPAMIVEQRNEPGPSATSEHLVSLLAKRLIVGAEVSKGKRVDEAAIKRLTGEDKITCRPNFKAEMSFYPTHTLMLHLNTLMHGLTRDFALTQRLLLVDFPWMYVENPAEEAKKNKPNAHRFRQKDKNLKAKFKQQLPSILRWMVEGCLAWQQQGINPPDAVLAAVDKLAKENDYMAQFAEDCLDYHPDIPGTRIPCSEVYNAFCWWWSENRDTVEQRTPALKSLTSQLRDKGYTTERKGGKYWVLGAAIKHDVCRDVDEYVRASASRKGK